MSLSGDRCPLPGGPCAFCKAEHQPSPLDELRDLLNTLEARIADQDTTIEGLRRRIAQLEHGREDSRGAINAQAKAIEALEARIGPQSVHVELHLVTT